MRFTGTRDDEGLTDRNLIDKLRREKKETKCLKLQGESLRITGKIWTSFACHETRWWSAALFDSGIGSPASNLLVATLWGRISFSMLRSFWNDRTRALATNQAYRNRAFDHRDRNVFIDIRWIRFKLGKLCPLDSPFSSQANCTRRNLKAKFVWWFSCQFSPSPPFYIILFVPVFPFFFFSIFGLPLFVHSAIHCVIFSFEILGSIKFCFAPMKRRKITRTTKHSGDKVEDGENTAWKYQGRVWWKSRIAGQLCKSNRFYGTSTFACSVRPLSVIEQRGRLGEFFIPAGHLVRPDFLFSIRFHASALPHPLFPVAMVSSRPFFDCRKLWRKYIRPRDCEGAGLAI